MTSYGCTKVLQRNRLIWLGADGCVHVLQSLPTLLLFRDGKAVDRIEGLLPEANLAQRLRFYIGRLDLKFGRR